MEGGRLIEVGLYFWHSAKNRTKATYASENGQKNFNTYHMSHNPICYNHQILVLIGSFSIFGS